MCKAKAKESKPCSNSKRRRALQKRRWRAKQELVSLFNSALLPGQLEVLILGRLPLPSLLRLRLLSKSANALLNSRSFLQQIACVQPSLSAWPVMVRASSPTLDFPAPKDLIAYCPPLGTWFSLPIDSHHNLISASGSGLIKVPLHSNVNSFPVLSALTMASCGGLLCCAIRSYRQRLQRLESLMINESDVFSVLVFNCFTGASKCLPRLPTSAFHSVPATLWKQSKPPPGSTNLFIFMLEDSSEAGAYFVALSHDVTPLPMFTSLTVYSSKTGCWKVGQALSATAKGVEEFNTFKQFGDAHLFCYKQGNWPTTPSPGSTPSATLYFYNIYSDAWSRVSVIAPTMPGFYYTIFKWQGRVFLASALSVRHAIRGFKVCELRLASSGSTIMRWVELARTPTCYWQGFYDFPCPCTSFNYHLNFLQSGSWVCMTGVYCKQDHFKCAYWPPLVFDIVADSWFHLSQPCSKGTPTDFGIGLLSLQPQLLATP